MGNSGDSTGILRQFDVKHWYNSMFVLAVFILCAAMFRQNTPVIIFAIGLLILGFGGRWNYSPETTIGPNFRYTVMQWEPTWYGWTAMTVGGAVMAFGLYRLGIAP
jgi:hypothetical protein